MTKYRFTMLTHMRVVTSLLLFLFFSLVANGQHGPMGIGNGDGSPTSAGPQPRLLLWLDGSSASPFTNNASLVSWNDKSGNGHHFVPYFAGAVYPPQVKTSGPLSGPKGTFSGAPETPVVKFINRDDWVYCADFELPGDGYTIYFVVKSSDSNYGLFSYASPTVEREMLIYNDNGIRQQMNNTLDRASAIGDINGGWNYGGILLDTSNDDNWEYNRNTRYEGGYNTFDGINFSATGSAMIGEIQNASGIYPTFPQTTMLPSNFVGDIAEIFIYEGRLSRPATRLLRTYMWVKYGLNGDSGGWDKYHGNMNVAAGVSWGGKNYAPIGIGRDNVNPNAGSENEARSEGLVLRVNQGDWTQSRTYLCAAPVGNSITGLVPNAIVTDGVSAPVLNRWNRLWEISGNNEGNGQIYQIAFDFGEGIGGDIPQNKDNYVLLYRDSPTSGAFSVLPVSNSDKFILDDELVFRVPKSSLLTPNRYYTIGTTDAASTLTGEIKRTWYAYQTGNWSDTLTWTLDGSAAPTYVNPDGDTPNLFDDVFIGTGRTVTVDVTLPELSNLKVFGTLDIASAAQPSFLTIAGSGLIRCAAGNFPVGNSAAFADPIVGGTLEFYGAGGFEQTTNLEVNKLKINLTNPASTITLVANLTNNGLFEVIRGTFVVNNTLNTSRVLTSNGQVLVESAGRIRVSNDTGLIKHKWYFFNDLINNGGEIRFTNRTASDENFTDAYNKTETQHIIEAYFSSGSNNQELRANGLSYFSRIIIDKGVDITYILSISSVNANDFKLLGRCNDSMGEGEYFDEIDNQNCFALINGTAEIRENIFIPLLINNGNYNINNTAQLWVNGGEVTKGRLGGTGTNAAIVLYGFIKVSAGTLNAFTTSGITIRGNGVVQVDGGTVNANQIRTSLLGTSNIGGLVINSGTVNINGNAPEGSENNYYSLSLTYPGNLFQMTGGVLNITGPTNKGLVFINSDPQNTSVTGGTVHLDVSDTQDRYKISSRAAFWDLTLTRSSTSSTNRSFKIVGGTSAPTAISATIPDQDLIIRNALSITGPNNPKLEMGTASTPADLYLTGNLNIGSGCEYIHNKNTTHFVGSSNSSLTFGGSTTFPFFNVEVNKDFDSRFATIQQTGPNPAMEVLGSLNLEKGYFINKNRHVEVKGSVTNRTQFGDDSSTGWLMLTGTSGRQEIISDEGVFYYLRINNADGVALKNDGITVKTRLTLDDGSLFIGDYKLRMETTNSSPISSYNGTDKFIVCSGNASAGGVEILNHSASQTMNYPIGVSTGSGQKYTLANVYINSGWADDGFIRITPVDTLLSTSNLSGSSDYLNFYWKVSSTGYDTKPNVTHRFKYDDGDVRGTDTNFESGRVLSELPFTRSFDDAPVSSHINFGSKLVYYNGADEAQATTVGIGTPLVNADYSAGAADRFPIGSSPDIFFSRSAIVGATWETPGNWNKLSECVSCTGVFDYHSTTKTASTTQYPESGDIAVIGFNVNSGGKPHVYQSPIGGIEAAQVLFTPLQDMSGTRQERYNGGAAADLGILRPTLQISNTSDIVKVAQISGEGELWLQGDIDLGVTDLGGFLSEDSSVVVINNGSVPINPVNSNFLPNTIPNLFLANTNTSITTDIRVRGNLEVAGASRLTLSENRNGNIEINGDLILDKYQLSSGDPRVLFNRKGTLKTINVHGDVKLLGTLAQIGINTSGGPEVPPAEWTPEEISAFLWLDAADPTTVQTSGAKVTGWSNKAGGSYNSAQLDVAKQPEVGAINGVNTIRFDGVDDFLSIPHNTNLNLLANQDFEIFAVSQITNYDGGPPNSYPVIYGKGRVDNDDFLLYVAINTFRVYMDGFGVNVPNTANINPNFGWARRQGNSAFVYNSIGGNASRSGASNRTNVSNTHDVTIGAAEDGTLRFLDGDIGEIILIKRALTNEERQQVEGYLAHKWGLEGDLPDGHPYKDAAPLVGGNNNTAQLIVDGDIIQNLTSTSTLNNGLELYKIGTDTASVNLVVTSAGNQQFNNISGPTPRLWKLRVNKGINTASSFTFNSDVDIDGPAGEPEKPVDIQNGLVKFNDSGIDITLSSGGGDFVIPNSGGLELNDGDLRITGIETGLLLSGSLNITGGSFTIADTDTEVENNYIEYGGGGLPKINVSGGTLIVGSQIRRNLSSTGGALDYRQSGGDVILGRYSAPELSRGVLEVTNAGSRFDHTGGTLTFVRGVTLGSTPSLLLTPATSNVSGSAEIIIGNTDSPSGAAIQNFGIRSSVALNALTINTTNSPVVNLITNNLELNDDLTIQAGATLNGADRNLILHGDVLNDGLLSSTAGVVSLIHPVSGTISGSGDFDLFDLERSGTGGLTLVQTNLLVNNNFTNDEGEMDFEGNTLTVKGIVTTDGNLKFDMGSNGLILNGTDPQILQRTSDGTSEIDIMTVNNDFGVTIPTGFSTFIIHRNLRLEKGVFSLTGNILEMAEGSTFTPVNPFSETNMIVTGGAFANFGVRMNVAANSTEDIFVPLGIDRFMPVNIDFSLGSSGTTPSSYLLKLTLGENGVIIQDVENPLETPECMTQINDLNNVLGMYFSVDGTNVGDGLNVDLKFRYDQQYVQVANAETEENYIAARVLADNTTISKLQTTDVDEVNNILTFNIQGDFDGNPFAVDGDYLAGINCAIPNTILVYTTISSGKVYEGLTTYDELVPGGGAPSGALVIVESGHTLTFDVIDGINFYRTEIKSGGRITIDETSLHRLGKVTGTGTIRVNGTGNLPAGDYTDFFGCGGGKLFFQADAGQNFEVLSNLPPIDEVTLRGSGDITIADNDVNICNNLIIVNGAKVKTANNSLLTIGGNLEVEWGEFDFRQGNTIIEGDLKTYTSTTTLPFPPFPTVTISGDVKAGNSGILTVEGNLEIGGGDVSLGTVFRETHLEGNLLKDPVNGTISNGTGGAKLVFDGVAPQILTGEFTVAEDAKIPFIELNNSNGLTLGDGLTLNGNLDVSDTLKLTDGNIFTSAGSLIKLTEDGTDVDPIGGQANSFVDGPMQWNLSSGLGERKFPIGNNDRYRPLSISGGSAARVWEVQYTDTIARIVPSIDPSMLPNPTNVPAIETVSIQEFWRIDSQSGSSTNANVRLSWGDSSAVSTNTSDQSNLLVLAYNPTDSWWDSYGGADFQYDAPTNSGNFISSLPVTFTERFLTLGSSDELNPLPVTWLYFEGETDGKNHKLSWATASEKNNEKFVLERSIDAQNWAVIAEIEGAGNSTERLDYKFTDRMAPEGRSYYRIKQVDYDGEQDYAEEVVSLLRSQNTGMGSDEIRLFPNPNKIGNVRILIPALSDVNTQISISDLNGRVVDQSIISFNSQGISESINCQFPPGMYIINVYDESGVWSAKLVVSP